VGMWAVGSGQLAVGSWQLAVDFNAAPPGAATPFQLTTNH
jgi:hypothetical protein